MQRLAFLEDGANFGELSLIDRAPRSATVVAEKDCEVFELASPEFDQFLKEAGDGTSNRFYRRCAEELVTRLRQQNADYIISQQLLWRYALRREESPVAESPQSESATPQKATAANR
jgi:CRP-like cAMP-binding protein